MMCHSWMKDQGNCCPSQPRDGRPDFCAASMRQRFWHSFLWLTNVCALWAAFCSGVLPCAKPKSLVRRTVSWPQFEVSGNVLSSSWGNDLAAYWNAHQHWWTNPELHAVKGVTTQVRRSNALSIKTQGLLGRWRTCGTNRFIPGQFQCNRCVIQHCVAKIELLQKLRVCHSLEQDWWHKDVINDVSGKTIWGLPCGCVSNMFVWRGRCTQVKVIHEVPQKTCPWGRSKTFSEYPSAITCSRRGIRIQTHKNRFLWFDCLFKEWLCSLPPIKSFLHGSSALWGVSDKDPKCEMRGGNTHKDASSESSVLIRNVEMRFLKENRFLCKIANWTLQVTPEFNAKSAPVMSWT